MSDIIKKCIHHGELTLKYCYKIKGSKNSYKCRKCLQDWTNKYTAKNRIKNEGLYLGCKDKTALIKKRTSNKTYNFKKRNKITIETYNQMLVEHNHVCRICKHPETKIDYRNNNHVRLCVDHCHETGNIRGLLCSRCNIALGCFDDSLIVIKSAVKYLEFYCAIK